MPGLDYICLVIIIYFVVNKAENPSLLDRLLPPTQKVVGSNPSEGTK